MGRVPNCVLLPVCWKEIERLRNEQRCYVSKVDAGFFGFEQTRSKREGEGGSCVFGDGGKHEERVTTTRRSCGEGLVLPDRGRTTPRSL